MKNDRTNIVLMSLLVVAVLMLAGTYFFQNSAESEMSDDPVQVSVEANR